jgi:hypothetical protein
MRKRAAPLMKLVLNLSIFENEFINIF